MKTIHWCLAIGLAVSLAACAFEHGPVAIQTIGPAPSVVIADGDEGYLVVYSAWDLSANFDRHTPYIVRSDDGKVDLPVRNQAEIFDQRPSRVELTPGKYVVIAPSESFGRVKVPVVVERGRTTVVYLDSNSQPRVAKSARTNLVTLPNGSIVGWAANPGK